MSAGASPYSTGGGGVVLEHRYAATLLASLLTSTPISELGDDCIPQSVRLQASDISPVDDVVVEGRTVDGGSRRVSIGVRRDPDLTAGDTASLKLVRSFLRVVTDNWDEVGVGRWRVALAVAVPNKAVPEVNKLASIAQSASTAAVFREMVARAGATNADDRKRLAHLRALAESAAATDAKLRGIDPEDLTWRWLSALRLHLLRIEGVDQSDRTASVASLTHLVPGGTTLQADDVFDGIAKLSAEWAPAAARVDSALLRRRLSGHVLLRSPTHQHAWSVLDGLARRLREGVRPDLAADGVRVELPRAEERTKLAAAMEVAGRDGGALMVMGEPDVGKSAITLRVAEALQVDGAMVLSLRLQDLPASVVDVETLFASPIGHVLASAETRLLRLLVVDGAEAVLEGRGDLLLELATASMQNGIGVIAVTRTDGSSRVGDVLQRAVLSTGSTVGLKDHLVGRLTAVEQGDLVGRFGALNRLGADARLEWLIGRPGLVDVLLRAGAVTGSVDIVCEADVFVAVWNGLIRNHEELGPRGASPDDREDTLLALAQRALRLPVMATPAGNVRAELRSDGVLRAAMNPALSAGDEFATDLIRDFALCRLFQTAGWDSLRTAGAPRWAIRAVSLACQAKLLTQDPVVAWRELGGVFAEISSAEGRRWSEMPYEALLALGPAGSMIGTLWDELAVDEQAGLQTLLRLAEQRFVAHTVGDPFILAPIVRATFCSDRPFPGRDRRFRTRGIGDSVRRLVLAWLRGMIRDGHGPDELRQDVGNRILAANPESYDEFAVEALAMLDADFDVSAEQWLRQIAADDPSRLHPAVESGAAARSLAQVKPELLIELTEAYYIEMPDAEDDWGHLSHLDGGIRNHRITAGTAGPLAAWFYGPFFVLLNTSPINALAMINRILDHAAANAVDRSYRRQRWDEEADTTEEQSGIDLEVPPFETRHYIGDAAVWAWYRGSTNGPYPCVSALLAIERFADYLARIGIPLADITHLLLEDCHNLAMPGLVVGLLIRHLSVVGDLLDPWLGHSDVWDMEFSRTISERIHFHVQGADSEDLVGRDLRGMAPPDVVAEITLRAFVAEDEARLQALTAVADVLLERACADKSETGDLNERLVVVERWASMFVPANYSRIGVNGGTVVRYEEPESVTTALAPRNAEYSIANENARLELTYAITDTNRPGPPPTDNLVADIALARRLASAPSVLGALNRSDSVAAVASTAIVSVATGDLTLDVDDLQWAAHTVLGAAISPPVDKWSSASAIYPTAADRSAARAVPALLLPSLDIPGIDEVEVRQALESLATSASNEVRTALVYGCATVWPAPCTPGSGSGRCTHEALWNAVQTGLRDCRLGPFDENQRERSRVELPPPYAQTLPNVDEEDLLVDVLPMPIGHARAAQSAACIAPEAAELLPVLLDAHRRGFDYWSTKGYSGYRARQREGVVRILVELAIGGEPTALQQHLRTFVANANALQSVLHDIAVMATYEEALRATLPTIWPIVLGTTLDALDVNAGLRSNQPWGSYAVAYLLPTPQLRAEDRDLDSTLARARDSWLPPNVLTGLAERWLVFAAGEPKAADAVAQFARTTSSSWQSGTALIWLEHVIDNRYDQCANRLRFVVDWLNDIRQSAQMMPDGLSRWRRVVDGLVTAGDSRAVSLQRIEE